MRLEWGYSITSLSNVLCCPLFFFNFYLSIPWTLFWFAHNFLMFFIKIYICWLFNWIFLSCRTARNPHAPDRYTGGSSSGPAAIVASGLCSAALGTDGGGCAYLMCQTNCLHPFFHILILTFRNSGERQVQSVFLLPFVVW